MTALRAEGCGIALTGDAYEVSVTGFTFGIIWQNKHYDDQPPPVAFPPLVPYGTTFPPLSGGTIKSRKAAFILAPIRAPTTTLAPKARQT